MPSKSFDGIQETITRRSKACDVRVEELLKHAGKINAADIAVMMNTTERAVRSLAQRHCISLRVIGKEWSEAEEKYLRKNATMMTVQQMADVLGRSYTSVSRFCDYRGIKLRKNGERHHTAVVSDDDVEMCRLLHDDKMPLKVIASKMEININTLQNIIYHRGRL